MPESDTAAMDETQTLTCFGCRAPVNAKLTTCPICGVRRPPEGWRDEGAAEQGLAAEEPDDDESETSAGMGLVVRLTKAPAPGQLAPLAEPRLRIAPIQRPPDGPQSLDEEELELMDEPDEDTQGEDISAHAAVPLQIRIGTPREEPTDEVASAPLGAATVSTAEPSAEPPVAVDAPLAWQSLPEGFTVLGRYRIERQIAEPSAYASYVAVQEPMVRRVVLTLMRGADVLPDASAEDRAVLEERFLADASAASGLRHPHVARVLDFGQAKDGTCYVISELVHGLTLHDLLERGRMPAQRSLGAMLQVARGVAAIHEAGLVHKNVSADQVVLELEGSRDKARLRPPAMGTEQMPRAKWIHSGNVRYQAPEVLAGDRASAASDVYAFGVLLHRAVHGAFPFEGDTVEAVAAAQQRGLTMPAGSSSPRVDALIQSCLAEVSTRNVSAFEIIEELREIEDLVPATEPVPAAPSGFKGPETVAPSPVSYSPQSLPPQAQTFSLLQAVGITLGASLLSAGLVLWVAKQWFPPEVQRVEVPVPVITQVPAPTPEPVAVEPTPQPTPVIEPPKVEKPRTVSKPRRSTRTTVVTPPQVEEEPVVVSEPVSMEKPAEPVSAPEPSPPASPAQLLSGSWVGRAGNTALNFQLAVDRSGLVGGTAKLVDGSTSEGAREGAVRGRVTQNADGTWGMELSMTSGGVTTTYAGVLAGDQATGKVSEDGKSKGKFVLAR
jgi:eukaryotic-like serine/threonine-protein kinase